MSSRKSQPVHEENLSSIRVKIPWFKDARYLIVGLVLLLVIAGARIVADSVHASPMPAEIESPIASEMPLLDGSGTATVENNQNGGIVNVGGTGRAVVGTNHGTVNIGVSGEPAKPMKTTFTITMEEQPFDSRREQPDTRQVRYVNLTR